jgi:hypothetical protein
MSDWGSSYLADDLPADSALIRYSEYYDEYFEAEEEECPDCHGTGLDREEIFDCETCYGDGVITILPKGLTAAPEAATMDGNDENEEG